jgi:hypothetical protein
MIDQKSKLRKYCEHASSVSTFNWEGKMLHHQKLPLPDYKEQGRHSCGMFISIHPGIFLGLSETVVVCSSLQNEDIF